MTSDLFIVDRCYSRRNVQDILSVPQKRRGGDWNTGYTAYDGAIFVFCNVGTAGRTGHDYPNRWIGDALEWSAKNGSRLAHSSIMRLVEGKMPVYVFWRDGDRKPFYYAGEGRATDVRDDVPVRLTWRFCGPESNVEIEASGAAPIDQYPEGAHTHLTVSGYERNPHARARCVEHYGAVCALCAFDFGAFYGDIGAGFIHVHHLRQLADVNSEYMIDPVKDLRPVCPNCHAMLHRRRPPYSFAELATMMASSSARKRDPAQGD